MRSEMTERITEYYKLTKRRRHSLYSFSKLGQDMQRQRTPKEKGHGNLGEKENLKSPLSLQSPKENGVDIGWDNNSPSPTVPLKDPGKLKKTSLRSGRNAQDLSSMIKKISKKRNSASAATEHEGLLLSTWMKREVESQHESSNTRINTRRNSRKASKSAKDHKLEGFQLKTNLRKFLDEVSAINSDFQGASSESNSSKVIEGTKTLPDTAGNITVISTEQSNAQQQSTIPIDNGSKSSNDVCDTSTKQSAPIDSELLLCNEDACLDSLDLGDLDDFGDDSFGLDPDMKMATTAKTSVKSASSHKTANTNKATSSKYLKSPALEVKDSPITSNSKHVASSRKISMPYKTPESRKIEKKTSTKSKVMNSNEDSFSNFSFGDDDAEDFIKASQLVEDEVKCCMKRKASKSPCSHIPILSDGNDSLAGIFEFPENDVIFIEDDLDTDNDFTKVKTKMIECEKKITQISYSKPTIATASDKSSKILLNINSSRKPTIATATDKSSKILPNSNSSRKLTIATASDKSSKILPSSSQSSVVDGIELNSDDDNLLDDMLAEFEEETRCKSQEPPRKIDSDQRKLLKRCNTSPYPLKSKPTTDSTQQYNAVQPRKKMATESSVKQNFLSKPSGPRDSKESKSGSSNMNSVTDRNSSIKTSQTKNTNGLAKSTFTFSRKPLHFNNQSTKLPNDKNSSPRLSQTTNSRSLTSTITKKPLPSNHQLTTLPKQQSAKINCSVKKPEDDLKRRHIPSKPNSNCSTVNAPRGFLPIDVSVIGSPGAKSKTEEKDSSILDQGDSTQMTQWASTQRCSTLDILKKREEAQRKLKEKMRLKQKAVVL